MIVPHHAVDGIMCSNNMRGRISPKVMAMMIRNAVTPLVAMLTRRAAGAVGPIERRRRQTSSARF
jgi:hypothetical protein